MNNSNSASVAAPASASAPYLNWQNLVCGLVGKAPLNYAFSGAIAKQGVHAILGPNGCGKSTFLRTLLGLAKPQQGNVQLLGKTPRVQHPLHEGIGYVPQYQKVNHFFHLSVAEFVQQGFGPVSNKALLLSRTKLRDQLRLWDLEKEEEKSFHNLSGGQKTRAMVARALVGEPKLLLLDEPLASLDACCQKLLMDNLHQLAHQKGVCVVMVDHHTVPFEHLLSSKIVFARSHNSEICTVNVEQLTPACCIA